MVLSKIFNDDIAGEIEAQRHADALRAEGYGTDTRYTHRGFEVWRTYEKQRAAQ